MINKFLMDLILNERGFKYFIKYKNCEWVNKSVEKFCLCVI